MLKTLSFRSTGLTPTGTCLLGPACTILLTVLLLLTSMAPQAEAVERRRDQYPKEPAYLVIPFPYNLPGIGSGIVVTGLAANIGGTNTDALGFLVTGDISGTFFELQQVHLIEEALLFRVGYFNIDKLVLNNYDTRGINSDPDEFKLLEFGQWDGTEVELCLCLFERQFELSVGAAKRRFRLERVRESNGEIIGEFTDSAAQESTSRFVRLLLDFTDDREDPRKGIRLQAERSMSPPNDEDDPDFFVTDISLSFYLPVGEISTIVFNYFQSDATVERQGQTDRTVLEQTAGLDCAAGDTICLEAEQRLIDQAVLANSNGTATSLGGAFSRLRSYPEGRFEGAHAIFYGVEFRWNLTDESTPFDYFIWKDVRTNFQVAFFAETGSVAESRDALDDFKSSYGVGFRLISASGFVYRADLATGDEGTEFVLIFGYPF